MLFNDRRLCLPNCNLQSQYVVKIFNGETFSSKEIME